MAFENHECDLFLLSSHQHYFANNALAEFARRGNRNIDGWGIASYREGQAHVLRSADPAFEMGSNDLSREFYIASQAVSGSLIMGHLRLSSRGARKEFNNHPFKLNFLEYDWTMVHNGTARQYENLVPHDERLLIRSNNDSARVFEYLRKRIIDYYLQHHKKSLIEGCRSAYTDLLNKDRDGLFNIILSNGFISFIFIHFRPFYILNREKDLGGVAVASTLRLTDDEEWFIMDKRPNKLAKMLVYSGPTLIFNGDIPR